jgi:murein DD-endopeptidase MepM/ murein hydrolase activator NlpD
VNAAGETDPLAIAFAEILAWEIDFYQDLREGDRFKVLIEKLFKEKQFVQYGTVYGVEYQQGEKVIRGFRYGNDYYDEEGASLRKAFLKAPLRFDRISSRFSGARRHPILGGVRPHYGIDYAAPAGTPIWAVADGIVLSAGRNGGFGKQVVIRHRNGYRSYYGHLSGYGPGIRKGVRVTQKQIIGHVGSTGLSTGPHLDYRLTKDGRVTNPLKEIFPAGDPIGKEELDAFKKIKDEIVTLMMKPGPYEEKLEKGRSWGLDRWTSHFGDEALSAEKSFFPLLQVSP